MQPPILIDYNGDLCIFRTVESAQSYLEPEDAAAPTTRIFDSEGRLLSGVHMPSDRWFDRTFGLPGRRICLVQVDETASHVEELREKLLRFLKYVGCTDEQLQNASLSRLVELSLPHASR